MNYAAVKAALSMFLAFGLRPVTQAHQNEIPLERKTHQNEIPSERKFFSVFIEPRLNERRNSQALYIDLRVINLLQCVGLFKV